MGPRTFSPTARKSSRIEISCEWFADWRLTDASLSHSHSLSPSPPPLTLSLSLSLSGPVGSTVSASRCAARPPLSPPGLGPRFRLPPPPVALHSERSMGASGIPFNLRCAHCFPLCREGARKERAQSQGGRKELKEGSIRRRRASSCPPPLARATLARPRARRAPGR